MGQVRFSVRARADLRNITVYTIQEWRESQADRYLNGLEDCCSLLGSNPGLGRRCDWILQGMRRMEKGRHVVFYREEPGGILVCRILHQGMRPEKHGFEDD
jgi:toxin ParE1/3/4